MELYSKKFTELREIKSIPNEIPYSAEFQKGTLENTLGGGGEDWEGGYCEGRDQLILDIKKN